MKMFCLELLLQEKCHELLYVTLVTAKVLAFCYQNGSISCFTNNLTDLYVTQKQDL
jgi:hypothetical protein